MNIQPETQVQSGAPRWGCLSSSVRL